MGSEEAVIAVRLLAAVVVGALIGFERTFHGRSAGFRTHALVCVASFLLMLVTVYLNEWMTVVPLDAIRTDPTRMAQGIMTGIGLLGADWPNITVQLARRGFNADELRKILGLNYLRFFPEVVG
jgi:putative Mg2+ transporter-C (MgtC) family protein